MTGSLNISFVLLLVLSGTLMPSSLHAQQMVRLVASMDNSMFSENDTLSNGSGNYFYAGGTNLVKNRRALIRFDFPDSIPAASMVDSVFLILTASSTNTTTDKHPIRLHRLTRSWGEGSSDSQVLGGGQGTMADSGDATWKWAFYDTSQWITPGGDFVEEASASTQVPGTGLITWNSQGMAGDVSMWLSDTSSNFGWILIGEEGTARSARRFNSRENPTVESRPVLELYYRLPTQTHDLEDRSGAVSATAYPNPFTEGLLIDFSSTPGSHIHIRIYDLLGRNIRSLDAVRPEGQKRIIWDGRDEGGSRVLPGMYYIVFSNGNKRSTIKVIKSF